MPGVRDEPAPQDWFETTFGFRETYYKDTREMFEAKGEEELLCKANNKIFHVGGFEVTTLESLAERAGDASLASDDFIMAGDLTFENIVTDTRSLYADSGNAGAVFQVSSLYNCLETTICNNSLRKEDGVTRYADHAAQGPASAIACPAATIYRNYFVSCEQEVNCLAEVGKLVKNDQERYFYVRNGYCQPHVAGSIFRLSSRIAQNGAFAGNVRSKLQVGIHWDTEVWTGSHRACQVFCSALPVADFKSAAKASDWEGFGRAVLEAAFEATLTAGVLLAAQRGSRVKVFLTPVGGGPLGNRHRWILDALDKALMKHRSNPLDVCLVHYAENFDDDWKKLELGREPERKEVLHKTRRKSVKSITKHAQDMQKLLEVDKSDPNRPLPDSQDDHFVDDLLPPCKLEEREDQSAVNQLLRLFATYDVNGEGYIHIRQFKDMLQHVAPDFFDPKVLDRLLASADADDKGNIHYAEFLAFVFDESVVTGHLLEAGERHRTLSSEQSII